MHTLRTMLTRPRPWLIIILIAYAVYATVFIWTTSAVVERTDANSVYVAETQRYFVLFDDMMISMRYAKNLANGDGLVWNPGGERVEGFTNPLWVGYMALWHTLGIDPATISATIQFSGALFMLLTLLLTWALALRLTGNGWVGVGAVLFTAFYLPLNVWSLQGTEVSILTLIVTAAALWTLRTLDAGRFSVGPYVLLGIATGVRVDMAVPFGMLAAFLFFADREHRVRHVIAAPLILIACLAPQFLLRQWYYGEWLPNTYHLKMAGYPMILRVLHGLEIATRFVMKMGVLPLGIFVFRRDRGVRLLAWLFMGQMIYNTYVGGDAWEHYGGANRYLSIAMPLWFVLLWAMIMAVYGAIKPTSPPGPLSQPRRLQASVGEGKAVHFSPALAQMGVITLGAVLLVSVNYTYGTGALEEWLLIRPSLYADENGAKVEQALLLDWLTTEDATVALSGAGIIPYFTDRPYVDLLGKNDATIAHLPMDRTLIPELKPGHMKWDYAYSIGELQPDVVLELWVQPQDAGPYLDTDYHAIWFPPKHGNVWMRQESPNVIWERIWGG
ncbi:MAG: hypothetical protein K8S97_06040 [Anaerolineae bacterium]|nr:hypothetical protein [Anaerolineae bacterium]